jgi:20S proteasome subunit alpha 2
LCIVLFFVQEEPSTQSLAAFIGALMQEYTQAGFDCFIFFFVEFDKRGVRPMGCSILLAGYDQKRKKADLYQIDPSGSFWPWKATSIGKDSATTKAFLEKRYYCIIVVEF